MNTTLPKRVAPLASALAVIGGSFVCGPAAVASEVRAPASETRAALMLDIETRHEGGRIAVALYRDAAAFRRNEAPVRTLMVDRDGPVTRAWVTGLAPGRYAIAAFHDLDGDGRLTTTMGMPREPFGFSNNARGRFGMPTFDSAAFDLPAGGGAQRIALTPILH